MTEEPWDTINRCVKSKHRQSAFDADTVTRNIDAIERRDACVTVETFQLSLQLRQTIALERIADRLTPVVVVNTLPDQAAQFPEILP